MADIWLDGFERKTFFGKGGMSYKHIGNPKALLHTIEGRNLEGAFNAYKRYPPHIGVDFMSKRRVQHIPLNKASYSLKNSAAERDMVIQVEIAGFASETQDWSDAMIDWLASDVLAPIHRSGIAFELQGPPQGFKGAHDGIRPYISSPSSPIRFSNASWRAFSGIVGHQHSPSPDSHWDPGAFRIAFLIERLRAHLEGDTPMTPAEKVAFDALTARVNLLEIDTTTTAAVLDRTTSPYEQVQSAYTKYLHRSADTSGLVWWVKEIIAGRQTIISLGRAVALSSEGMKKRKV